MLLWILLGILAAGVACVAYGVLIERRWYRLARYRVDILPAGWRRGLEVLHLSDLHFVKRDGKKERFLARLPTADITVVTGDFLAEPAAVETAVAALRPVRGRVASYFVLGSNDYYVPRPLNYVRYFRRRPARRKGTRGRAGELVALLEADGWKHLENQRSDVPLDGSSVEVVGIDDPHIHRPDLRAAPRSSNGFGLAIVHSPDPAPELVALGYDLVVAGHTHGGQVRMPLVGALVNNCALPRWMSMGLIRIGPSYMHVSPGLGTSKYAPFRFLCRPEATLLDLRPSRPLDR